MGVDTHLLSTVAMLRAAFPGGIPAADVLPVARVLYDHMSDRNLAEVLAATTGGESLVLLNEIAKATALAGSAPRVVSALARLEAHGFAEWTRSR